MTDHNDMRKAVKLARLVTTGNLVFQAKKACRITAPNAAMDDGEIGKIMRWIGQSTGDTILGPGGSTLGVTGIGLMLFATLEQFPEFFQRRGLSQVN